MVKPSGPFGLYSTQLRLPKRLFSRKVAAEKVLETETETETVQVSSTVHLHCFCFLHYNRDPAGSPVYAEFNLKSNHLALILPDLALMILSFSSITDIA
jgi:hypothetical protein